MDKREQRFRELYGVARPRIVAYVLRRASSPEDAADVIAEAFTVAWRRIDDVPDGEGGVLWLFATARNLLANDSRRKRRRTETIEHLAVELGRVQLHATEPVDEERLIATHLLARLSPDDREVLMLATWEGLTSEQLALALNCSSTAARLRLHRARARLARELRAVNGPLKQPDAGRHEQSEAEIYNPRRKGSVE